MDSTPLNPVQISLIEGHLAIAWSDGLETFLPEAELRAASPSAETTGERDLLGRRMGGEWGRDYSAVSLQSWETVGGYALKLRFSDGHASGLYSYEYIRALGRELGG